MTNIASARAKIVEISARLSAARVASIPTQFRAQLDKMIPVIEARVTTHTARINEIESCWPADSARTDAAEEQMLVGGLGKPMVIDGLKQIEAQVAQIEAGIAKISAK